MLTVEIANLASRISIGEVQAFRNLAVVPLLDPSREPAGYLALDEALRLGQTEITEISDAGSVPQLELRNRGPEEVFLLDGEELIGAKQNRILNLSILVPGHTELEISGLLCRTGKVVLARSRLPRLRSSHLLETAPQQRRVRLGPSRRTEQPSE